MAWSCLEQSYIDWYSSNIGKYIYYNYKEAANVETSRLLVKTLISSSIKSDVSKKDKKYFA